MLVVVGLYAQEPAGVKVALAPPTDRVVAAPFKELSHYRGKVLLLNFWATYCGGCKQELPWFQAFDTALRKRGLAVLAMSVDEGGWAEVRPYVAKAKLKLKVGLAGKPMIDSYGLESLPTTVLIDRKGRIAARYVGLVDRDDVERNLLTLIAER
jgi:thiol-disulfide isomerase/thioredoxin